MAYTHNPSYTLVLSVLGVLLLGLGYAPLHPKQARLLGDCTRDADAASVVVVLGYACDHLRGVPTATLSYRIETAVELWRRSGGAIVLSGGASEHARPELPSEASIMHAYAKRLLRPAEHPTIRLENRSTSTRENALFSLRMLESGETQEHTVAIVTSTFHQWRALRVFRTAARELGLLQFRFTIPCARGARERGPTQFDWFREIAACALYWWRGWI
jgi:uncharacterized SAM-binding protein YcdF (DUF218 family)